MLRILKFKNEKKKGFGGNSLDRIFGGLNSIRTLIEMFVQQPGLKSVAESQSRSRENGLFPPNRDLASSRFIRDGAKPVWMLTLILVEQPRIESVSVGRMLGSHYSNFKDFCLEEDADSGTQSLESRTHLEEGH